MAGEDQGYQSVTDLLAVERSAVFVSSHEEVGQDALGAVPNRYEPAMLDEREQCLVQLMRSTVERQPASPLEEIDGENLDQDKAVAAATKFQDAADPLREIVELFAGAETEHDLEHHLKSDLLHRPEHPQRPADGPGLGRLDRGCLQGVEERTHPLAFERRQQDAPLSRVRFVV